VPQPCQVSQRRFLVDQIGCPGFWSMPSTDSNSRRPPIPVFRKNWTHCCRNRWSAWPGMGGRHPSESMVGMTRIMQQAVFHKLRTRNTWDPRYETTHWKDYSGNEVDFVVIHNKAVEELMQVTFASSLIEVSERETKALVKATKALRRPSGTLITWDLEQTTTIDGVGVKYVPLWKWLLTTGGDQLP
jgi:predicted AAA+ superfamily ATPase